MKLAFVLLLGACVENPLVICDNGLACPVGLVCDTAHAGCVLPSQLEACTEKTDGTRCSYPGVASGTCSSGVCLPAVCGTGIVDADEECDDNNRLNGDGCSADCLFERCGNSRLDTGEACDDGDLRSRDGCSSSCTIERPDWHQLSLTPLDHRSYAAVAHDPIREHTTAYGGASSASLVGDTWEWFDRTWSPLSTVAGPPKRLATSFAYDIARREGVLFGGLVNGTFLTNDTWLFDGARWQQRMTMVAPPSRNRGAIAYDARRKKTVLFGGFNGVSLDDTWEWDGTTWTQRFSAGATPRTRTATAFAYDPSRGTIVLVGGLDDQTFIPNDMWEWNGTMWTELHPATTPNGTPLAMAYDVAHQRMVLLTFVSNTITWWQWTGDDWMNDPARTLPSLQDGSVMFFDQGRDRLVVFGLRPTNELVMYEDGPSGWEISPAPLEPPTRSGTAMAYDGTTGAVMLFGGRDASTTYNDLWAWTGARWEQLSFVGGPTPRYGHAMAWDAKRGELVVVGGRTAGGRTGETWVWNGSWRMAGTMPPHENLAVAYDAAHGRVIAFGGVAVGFDGFDHHVSETWQWDGSSWTEIAIGGGPPGRADHGMAYDVRRKRIVLFGGASEYQTFNDFWEFDGTAWTQRTANVVPSPRSLIAMAYDDNRGATVVLGGKGTALDNFAPLGDTWEWDGTDWTPIATFATPPRHFDRVAAFHPGSGRFVVFGGDTRETWLYGYGGDLPQEVCGSGHDVDRDGLVGCSDPDCAWACAECGDRVCQSVENCRLCPSDCGACVATCGDNLCDPGEECMGDCPP